jgi:hypothetical protein
MQVPWARWERGEVLYENTAWKICDYRRPSAVDEFKVSRSTFKPCPFLQPLKGIG